MKKLADKLILTEILKERNLSMECKNLNFKDFAKFSLTDYQQSAVKNALKILEFYYSRERENLLRKYREFDKNLNAHETNRASFWMATGSGKTIVMIKLIWAISRLIKLDILPKKPILLLAPTEQILSQFKERINEFNRYQNAQIDVRELKDFESINSGLNLYDTTLFIARSDLLENAENTSKKDAGKRLNYANFKNENGWYILLDEAHKGDSTDSVRKGYINELASGKKDEFPRGFILNFSATFTDEIDLKTCAFNYNLQKFNNQGYGKNIAIFENKLNLDDLEQILQSFIIFTSIKISNRRISRRLSDALYHAPLIIAVSDKVNTQDAGIKQYFEAICKVLTNDVDIPKIVENLVQILNQLEFVFGGEKIGDGFIKIVKNIDAKTMREELFYAQGVSSLEACIIKGNDKEIAFKSKNASKPFMLLNIGDTKGWKKEYLNELGVQSEIDVDNGFFAHINERNSPINIMLGSKVFSEGWDSNRVNLISFINIGSRSAKKYVTQTIGRGVRIEPFKNERQRLRYTSKFAALEFDEKERLKELASGPETLFVFASDPKAIEAILSELEQFKTGEILKGFKKSQTIKPLLLPQYEDEIGESKPYVISHSDYKNLNKFINSYDLDVLLLSSELKSPDLGLSTINKTLKKDEKFIKISGATEKFQNPKFALCEIDKFRKFKSKKLKGFKEVENEISHFTKFSTTFDKDEISKINEAILNLLKSKSEDELIDELESKKITSREFASLIKQNKKDCEILGFKLDANLARHYYNPLVIDADNKAQIVYAISEKSEIEFLKDLKTHTKALDDFEWNFCKIVQNVDEIYVPYFDEEEQIWRKFYPDFIFWLKQDEIYEIVFVDPKGLKHGEGARFKANGFETIFGGKNLEFNDNKIIVKLAYYNKDLHIPQGLEKYVFSSINEIFKTERKI
ncbi:DEAD/DEAH box helicase family protein [uncultured Campylobacter sp.]|uniref:DEAD/DEAH box helicase family protein n=1 Tax=uncultured Campylobacter sp. TaxID=218934 RepID=UPI002636AD5D|nr:DEAD/DEAH box helicase family protein [uncultured Campylobacter sp.]